MNEPIELGQQEVSKADGRGEKEAEKLALEYAKVCRLSPVQSSISYCILFRRRKRPSVVSGRGWNFSRR